MNVVDPNTSTIPPFSVCSIVNSKTLSNWVSRLHHPLHIIVHPLPTTSIQNDLQSPLPSTARQLLKQLKRPTKTRIFFLVQRLISLSLLSKNWTMENGKMDRAMS